MSYVYCSKLDRGAVNRRCDDCGRFMKPNYIMSEDGDFLNLVVRRGAVRHRCNRCSDIRGDLIVYDE